MKQLTQVWNWFLVGSLAICLSFAVDGSAHMVVKHFTGYALPLFAIMIGAVMTLRRKTA